MRDADPSDVADELARAAARRMHDRQPARHRLDDERRTRILHLRVQQQVRAPEDVRRIALRIAADEVHAPAEIQLVEQRLDRADEPPGDEELRVGALRAEAGERPQGELQPVLLRLIASEKENGPAGERRRQPG